MIFGHGVRSEDGQECLVTSDGNLIPFEEIRSKFDANNIKSERAVTSIRIFIIDASR